MSDELPDFETYEDFLKAAIHAYWTSGKADKVTLLGLLLATRETWGVALDKTLDPKTGKKALTGAAGAAAVAVLIRAFLGGPLGLLLAGASVASLVGVYVKNHDRIWAKVGRMRGIIDEFEARFDELSLDARESSVRKDQRGLMMEGLMGRFLVALDTEPPPEAEKPPVVDELDPVPRRGSFAAHVADKESPEEE